MAKKRIKKDSPETLPALRDDPKEEVLPFLDEAEKLYQELTLLLESTSGVSYESISPPIERLLKLPGRAQSALLNQLVIEKKDKSLEFFAHIIGKGLDLTVANSLALLPAPESAEILQKIYQQSTNKDVNKAIKKTLHRLKTRGITLAELVPTADTEPVWKPPPTPQPQAYLSSIDQMGVRVVWLIQPGLRKGLNIFQAALSETKGIIDFDTLEAPRKWLRQLFERAKENRMLVVEGDYSYAQFLIEEGYQKNQDRKINPPPSYLEWRSTIGITLATSPQPLIYQLLKAEEIKADPELLARSVDLHELPEFRPWVLIHENAEKYITRGKEAAESKILLNPLQQKERLETIFLEAVEELFREEERALYKRRLEEMAYLLHKTQREEEAKKALAAALGLGTDLPSHQHPFVEKLVKKSINLPVVSEKEKDEQEEPSLIVKPWERHQR
ncbi:MAG: hypothetical protein JSU92_05095 [Deltaproteobacteria bacterium]|nr:MAG: hypothetical protein JSU92_05095 [Deltaproteobacteria bacterium]